MRVSEIADEIGQCATAVDGCVPMPDDVRVQVLEQTNRIRELASEVGRLHQRFVNVLAKAIADREQDPLW